MHCAGSSVEKSALGGYTVLELTSSADHGLPHPSLVLIGTGTELSLALQTAQALHAAHAASNSRYSRCCLIFNYF